MDQIKLNSGYEIPQIGLGVFMILGDEETRKTCLAAFEAGYRHIDTAHAYGNERGVGQALKESGLRREEVFLTSKLWPNEYGEEITSPAIDKMRRRLGVEYIDLLLLHQQVGDYVGAWKAMETAVTEGKVRGIGLSNFESERLEEVLSIATVPPTAIQVECHPYYQQSSLKARVAASGTKMECWYPIGHGDSGLLQNPVFVELASRYGKTTVQIILRWHIQEGNIIIPKSTNPVHLKENIDIFDFALTDAEMDAVRALDKGVRYYNVTLEEQEKRYLGFKLGD